MDKLSYNLQAIYYLALDIQINNKLFYLDDLMLYFKRVYFFQKNIDLTGKIPKNQNLRKKNIPR
jgi:hypothetical protein